MLDRVMELAPVAEADLVEDKVEQLGASSPDDTTAAGLVPVLIGKDLAVNHSDVAAGELSNRPIPTHELKDNGDQDAVESDEGIDIARRNFERVAEIQVRPQEVPMVPDGSIKWEKHEVPSMEGSLLIRPELRGYTAAEMVSEVVQSGEPVGDQIKSGFYGTIYEEDNVAIKVFGSLRTEHGGAEARMQGVSTFDLPFEHSHGMDGLKAAVAFETGLRRQAAFEGAQVNGQTTISESGLEVCHHPGILVTSPKMFAAYIPDVSGYDALSPAIWAMSFESGRNPTEEELQIDAVQRAHHYVQAVQRVGLTSGMFAFDDKPSNLLLRVNNGKQELIKLDVSAADNGFARL